MHRYRRNVDEKLRKLQREVFGGDVNAQALLLAERLRGGFVSRNEVETAAYFNHPAALKTLGRSRTTFEEFYSFLDSQNKRLTITWVHCVANHALSIWHECMIKRSTGSSEERALSDVTPGLRHLIEAPSTAVSEIQNWLLNGDNTDILETLCDFLSEVSSEINCIRSGSQTSQMLLWDPNDAANAAIESIAKATCAPCVGWSSRLRAADPPVYNNSRLCNFHAAMCYRNAVKAVQLHRNCSVEDAGDELQSIILNNMFSSL